MQTFSYLTEELVEEFRKRYPLLNLTQPYLDTLVKGWREAFPDVLIDVGALPDACGEHLDDILTNKQNLLEIAINEFGFEKSDFNNGFALIFVTKKDLTAALKTVVPVATNKETVGNPSFQQVRILVHEGALHFVASDGVATVVHKIEVNSQSIMHDVALNLLWDDVHVFNTWAAKAPNTDDIVTLIATPNKLLAWVYDKQRHRRFNATNVPWLKNVVGRVQRIFQQEYPENSALMSVNTERIKHIKDVTVLSMPVDDVAPFVAQNGKVFGTLRVHQNNTYVRNRADLVQSVSPGFFNLVDQIDIDEHEGKEEE